MDFEARLINLEKTVERHSDRLTAIEKRTSEDHETLKLVKKDVDEMKTTLGDVTKDVKAIKQQNTVTNDSLLGLTKWIKICIGLAIVSFCYSVIRNESIASAVASLGSTLGKLLL